VNVPILQITDCHIGSDWIEAAPLDTLRRVVAAVRALPDRPQVALITGDITNDGDPADYERVAAVLAELELPLFAIPGNHDGRAGLRHVFALPGEGDEPIQYAVDLDGLRVLMLDTQRPGEVSGELGPERLAWLARELSASAGTPTLLAMHHPPIDTGIAGMDAIGLPVADRAALRSLLEESPQVVGIVAGHVHRAITGSLAGRPVVTVPSSYAQLVLDFERTDLPMGAAPPAFALHLLVDGRLVSHVETVS
jgi:3',5'-cyclic AMP phosphodiesterase CpdA